MERDAIDDWADRLRQTLPEDEVRALVTAKRLKRAGVALGAAGMGALGELDVDPGEYEVLATLLRLGDPHEASPTALGKGEAITSSGMTKRLDRLEKRGLVERRPDPSDRRALLVRLTAPGVELAQAAVDAYMAAMGRALTPLSSDEQDQLAALLRRLDG